MPVIKLEYDDAIVTAEQMMEFSDALRSIVVNASGRPESEVCVYGNVSQIKINVAPVQIWLEMSDYKVVDADELSGKIREQIAEWKSNAKFAHQIKFTLTPIAWKVVTPI